MQIPVVIEPVMGDGYRARTGEPVALMAEGTTPDEALQRLRELVQGRVANGVQIVPLDLPDLENPWVRYAGMFKDNPLFDEWQEAIAEYRRQRDAEDIP